jgi:hypothetical protein
MIDFKTAADAATEVRKAIIAMKAQRDELNAEKHALLKEKNDLYRMPLSKEDIKQFIFEWIDKSAEFYPENSGWNSLIRDISLPRRDPSFAKNNDLPAALTLFDVEQAYGENFDAEGLSRQVFGMTKFDFCNIYAMSRGGTNGICFFFGELIKAKIDLYFDRFFPGNHAQGKEGPPVADRYAMIEKLNVSIKRLSANIADIDSKLSLLRYETTPGLDARGERMIASKIEV